MPGSKLKVFPGEPSAPTTPDEYLSALYRDLGSQKNDFRNANLIQLVASLVTGERVLDIGCGSGVLLAALQRQGKEVLGVEPHRDIVQLAGEMHPGVEIFRGTGDDIDRLDRRFDTVTIIDVLEHIDDDRRQLRKIHGVLNDGGQLIVVVPAFQWLYGRRDASNGHWRRYSQHDLVEKLNETGFLVRGTRFWNMLGMVPYWVSERLLKRELSCDLRREKRRSWLQRSLARGLYSWFENIENHVSFGVGLSLICIAERAPTVATGQRHADSPPLRKAA